MFKELGAPALYAPVTSQPISTRATRKAHKEHTQQTYTKENGRETRLPSEKVCDGRPYLVLPDTTMTAAAALK